MLLPIHVVEAPLELLNHGLVGRCLFVGRESTGHFVLDNHAAIDGIGAARSDGDVVVPFQRIDLGLPGEVLQKPRDFNLQVHLSLCPVRRFPNLLRDHHGARVSVLEPLRQHFNGHLLAADVVSNVFRRYCQRVGEKYYRAGSLPRVVKAHIRRRQSSLSLLPR